MLSRRHRTWTGLAVVALAAAVGAATACDLNPQPLPPGFTGSAVGDGGDGTAAPVLGNGDASTSLLGDSGATGFNGADAGDVGAPGGNADGGVDGSAPGAGDGGDAGDAGDGGDAGDAGDAGAMDGSTDANEDSE